MLEKYELNSVTDKKNAIKEIVQEIILASLSKTNFFKETAFYGGTALRIFHGLDRFSEDLDFSLLIKDDNFNLESYFNYIKTTIASLGLNFDVSLKVKRISSHIESAFLKGNTKEQFLTFYPRSEDFKQINKNETIKIKFEVDVDPPAYAQTELKYGLLPFPYEVRIYDRPSLFAGKIHAVLARGWKTRIKGRDLYDFIFFITTNTPVNIKHLEARLKQTKTIEKDIVLTKEVLFKLLNKRFDAIDYVKAKEDVEPFIKDANVLNLWSSNFFKAISANINTI